MKIVDLQKLWNYVVDNFLIWNHLIMQNYVYDLGRKNLLNKNCRSQKVMKLCSWPLFDLNSFRASKKQFTLSLPSAFFLALGKEAFCRVHFFLPSANQFFELIFEALNEFKWKTFQLQSCITSQDLQSLFCSFLHLTKRQ